MDCGPRTSPLGPVSGLNRSFGSVATGPQCRMIARVFRATPFPLVRLCYKKGAVR